MATWELQLISRIVRTGDFGSVISWGITPDDFLTNEGRALFSSIQGYYSMPEHNGAVLGPFAIQRMFPNFHLCDDTSMTTEALCTEVRKQRLSVGLRTHIQRILEMSEFDPMGAINKMQLAMTDLQNVGLDNNRTDVHFHNAFDRVLQKYNLIKQGVDLSCGSWPWDPLQHATMGLQPDDYVVIYGRPKCVPVGTEILTPSGEFQAIEDATSVMGMDEKQELGWHSVEHKTEVVRRNVLRVRTQSGYEAVVGEDHPLLRPDLSYTETGHLKVGDHIGVAGVIPWPRTGEEQPAYFELLGLLTGDGNYTRNEVQFINMDEDIVARAEELATGMGCVLKQNKPGHYRLVGNNPEKGNAVLDALRAENMWGKTATEKTAPKSLFKKPQDCIAAFLGGLLVTDGGVYKRSVRWNTSSQKLAKQIKHLLLRLGLVGVLGEVTTDIGTKAYTINVFSQEQHRVVLGKIGPFMSSHRKLEKLIAACNKEHLQTLAKGMNAPEPLKRADSHIRWEPITEIEHLGEQDCIDIGVRDVHNFLVGDIVTHNSMKSWVLAYLIAWFHDMGKRMVIYTKEMTADNIFQRAGACLASVRYAEFRTGDLTYEEESSLYAVSRQLHYAQQEQTVVCLSAKDAVKGGDTVPWLRSKLDLYKPDVCFIDGMYLMTDVHGARKDHARVQNISRDIRQMVLDTGVPSICTVQANRKAAANKDANLDEIAFSDAIGQDATLLMRAINEKDKPTVALVMGGASREFALEGFRIFAVPAFNFDYAGDITAKEIEKAKEQDHDTEEGDSKHTPGTKKATKRLAAHPPTEAKAASNTINQLNTFYSANR